MHISLFWQADFLSTGDQDVSCRKISRNNLTFSGAVQEVNPVQFRAQLTKFCYYKFKVRAVVKEKQATTQSKVYVLITDNKEMKGVNWKRRKKNLFYSFFK